MIKSQSFDFSNTFLEYLSLWPCLSYPIVLKFLELMFSTSGPFGQYRSHITSLGSILPRLKKQISGRNRIFFKFFEVIDVVNRIFRRRHIEKNIFLPLDTPWDVLQSVVLKFFNPLLRIVSAVFPKMANLLAKGGGGERVNKSWIYNYI